MRNEEQRIGFKEKKNGWVQSKQHTGNEETKSI